MASNENGSRAADRRQKMLMKQLKAARGLDRKRFFEEGGEQCRWRGLSSVIPDKKKQEHKKRRRGRDSREEE